MRPFEDYVEREMRATLRRETRCDIHSYWSKRARELHRENQRAKLALWISVVVWAVFVIGVLVLAPVETPVETVHESETLESVPAAVLTLDAPGPVLDVSAEQQEAAEPESPFYREDIPLDYDTQSLLYEACGETGIRYELALAVVWKETTFRNVVGDGGESYGYMQVQPKWHSDRMAKLGVTDLMDPSGNFRVGCDYLAELLEKYELPEALTAYNTGSPGHNQYADDVIGYMEGLV